MSCEVVTSDVFVTDQAFSLFSPSCLLSDSSLHSSPPRSESSAAHTHFLSKSLTSNSQQKARMSDEANIRLQIKYTINFTWSVWGLQ